MDQNGGLEPQSNRKMPFGQDFTPATLGKLIGQDQVLPWLLDSVQRLGSRQALAREIASQCLSHVADDSHRRDMASHVVTALRSYGLMTIDADDVALTPVGQKVRRARDEDRYVIFAAHILTECSGQTLVEAVERHQLLGENLTLESLSIALGEPATSKNLSTMRAWLARAGVMAARGPYQVLQPGLRAVLGKGAATYFGLSKPSLEFLLSARILEQQHPGVPLDAVEVADLTDARLGDLRIPRKSLGSFVKKLAERGHVELVPRLAGVGGSRTAFRLLSPSLKVSDEQLRNLLAQTQSGLDLSTLRPLREVISALGNGTAHEMGHCGEQLAIHLCLMMGLRVRSWRRRAPHSEIDLIADRVSNLTYERWAVQVKNTSADLDNDQVTREIGATSGMGVTHLLFVVPRAEVTGVARKEIDSKNRLTHAHIYVLSESMLVTLSAEHLLSHLRVQMRRIESLKRSEAESREA
jgi:hypothetical protein